MSSTHSSRSSSPAPNLFDHTPTAQYDYIGNLAKHSGHDALAKLSVPVEPASPGTESAKPSNTRTFSGLEEGRSSPKSRPSVVSALMKIGSRPTRHRSSARRTIVPSDLQKASFSSPVTHLRQGSPSLLSASPTEDLSDYDLDDGPIDRTQYIVNHVEGWFTLIIAATSTLIFKRHRDAPKVHPQSS
jgi:hypothetical protein